MSENALTKAGEDLERQALLKLGAMLGGAAVLEELSYQFDVKRVEMMERVREEKLYLQAGFKTWEDCCKSVFGVKRTVDRKIRELKEQGADLYELRQMVRIGQSTYELMAVRDGYIEHDGKRIAISKANEVEIKGIIKHYQEMAKKSREDGYEKERALKKARDERDNAKKAVEKTRQELQDLKSRDEKLFPNASPTLKRMLKIQSDLDFAMLQLSQLGKEDLGTADQGRLIGLIEHTFRQLVQISHAVRSEYGVGWNEAHPGDLLVAEDAHAGSRDLLAEYVEANKKNS